MKHWPDYYFGLIVFAVFCVGAFLGGVIGFWIESQIWLAHCAQALGTMMCSHP
jgi:hypothetical protein